MLLSTDEVKRKACIFISMAFLLFPVVFSYLPFRSDLSDRSYLKTVKVIDNPLYKDGKISFVGKIKKRDKGLKKCISKKIFIQVGDYVTQVKRGDLIVFDISPSRINRKDSYFTQYLFSRGIDFRVNTRGKDIKVISKGGFYRIIYDIKRYIERTNDRLLPYPHSVFISSIMTGNRYLLPNSLKEVFIRSGTFHILAISGLHVGFVAFVFIVIFKIIKLNHIVRRILVPVPVILYSLFIGNTPSILRATLMFSVASIIYIFDRDRDYINLLALVFVIFMIINSRNIFNPGFLLSFLATFGILFLSPVIYSVLKNFVPSYINGLFSASIGATIYTFPVFAVFFSGFSYISVLANIFVIPLTGLIFAFDFIILILYRVYLPIANLASFIEGFLINILFDITRFFGVVPPIKTGNLFGSIGSGLAFIYGYFLFVTYFIVRAKKTFQQDV